MWLHINTRFSTSLLHIKPTEFCAWIRRPRPVGSEGELSRDAIREVQLKECDPVRYSYDWLNRPVFVSVSKGVKNRQDVSVDSRLPSHVRLVPPDLCHVCTPNTGELCSFPLQAGVEDLSLRRNGEVDESLLPLGKVRCSPSLIERPSDVVETASVVVNHVSKEHPPKAGERLGDLGDHADAVTLRVVVLAKPRLHLEIGLFSEREHVVQEHLGIAYALDPFEPSAIEGVSHAR